jgi:hypothetical protein
MNKNKREQYKELITACVNGDTETQNKKLDTLVQVYINTAMTNRGIDPNYQDVFRVGEQSPVNTTRTKG